MLHHWKRFDPPTWLPACALGMLLTSLLYYPGHLNGDSKWQMSQALTGQFNTHHPVIMAYVWHFLMRIVPGSGSIFLFHAGAFWLGVAFLLEERLPALWGRLAAVLAYAAWIPLSVSFFIIVKDTGLAACMVLATGALLRYERTREPWLFALTLLALTYASHVRHNGVLATAPYFIWAARLLPVRSWKKAAVGIALIVLVPWRLYEAKVIRPFNGHEGQIPLLYDIVAISVAKNENFAPEFYNHGKPPLGLFELKQLYDPLSSLPLFWPPPSVPRQLGWVQSEREWVILEATWLAVIAAEPAAYLAHRLDLTVRLLGFHQTYYWPYWLPSDVEFVDIHRWNKPVQQALTTWIQAHRNAFLFKSWFYFLMMLILSGGALARVRKQPAAFTYLWVSVVVYEAGFFLMAADADFRFSCWTMFACTILPWVARFKPAPPA